MESFPMLHGYITYMDAHMIAMKFKSPEGFQADAVAAREVCYIGAHKSKFPPTDFSCGQQIQFSAILSQHSKVPDVWKAVVVWTQSKPEFCFKVCDWNSSVSKFYTDADHIQNIIAGKVHQKILSVEVETCLSLLSKIKFHLQQNKVLSVRDGNLDEALNPKASTLDYIKSRHGSVANFIGYHSGVFSVSGVGNIFTHRSKKKLENYLYIELPQKMHEECLQKGEDKSASVEENCVVEDKIFRLEKEAVEYFSSELKASQEHSGIVYCLSSLLLENVLEISPRHICKYIKRTYKCLSQFLKFHSKVFKVGPCQTIYPSTEGILNDYLTKGLESVVSYDESDNLYNNFVASAQQLCALKEAEVGSHVNLSCTLSDEIYYSDNEEGCNKSTDVWADCHKVLQHKSTMEDEESLPEIKKTFREVASQTLSTGPIQAFSTFDLD